MHAKSSISQQQNSVLPSPSTPPTQSETELAIRHVILTVACTHQLHARHPNNKFPHTESLRTACLDYLTHLNGPLSTVSDLTRMERAIDSSELPSTLKDSYAEMVGKKLARGYIPVISRFVLKRNIEMIQQLLIHGAEINAADPFGYTCLHMAADGDKGIASMLAKHGADMAARDEYGQIPLHFAVEGNNLGVVDVLLAFGSDIDAQDYVEGATPLMDAVRAGFTDMVIKLVKHGADISMTNFNGETALDLAADKPDILALLQSE